LRPTEDGNDEVGLRNEQQHGASVVDDAITSDIEAHLTALACLEGIVWVVYMSEDWPSDTNQVRERPYRCVGRLADV
jgi:hypothetical protein